MIDILLGFGAATVGVVFWELVKLTGLQIVKVQLPPAVSRGLLALDQLLPSLIAEGISGAELEERLRRELGALTGSDWSAMRRQFDPVAFLDNLRKD